MPSFSNRSVVVIDPYRSLYISFQPECLHVLLVHCNPFLMSFNLQGLRNVPCSPFLTECFQLCSSSLFSSLKLFQPLRFFGFTLLSRSNFVLPLPLPFLSGAILRSRDEIPCKWRSVVTPRDRRFRCLPCFASQLCYLFVWFVAFIFASCALHHVYLHPFLKLN